jgi:RNA polymerase sigma-70 factor, ECF subfamily
MAQPLPETRLREWMQRMGPRLINLAAAICRDRHQGEEIVQEAFVKLWQRPPEAGEAVYPAWLRRVVVNLAINALHRTRRPAALIEAAGPPVIDAPGRRSEAEESVAAVRAALDRLDESKRAILVLRAWEQLSYEEIAVHLDVPVGTVMSRLNRARTALMEELKRDEDARSAGRAAREQEPIVYDIRRYRSA